MYVIVDIYAHIISILCLYVTFVAMLKLFEYVGKFKSVFKLKVRLIV